MKKLSLAFLALVLVSCSFDNKTGIWKDASDIPVDKQVSKSISNNQAEKKYEEIFTKQNLFREEVEVDNFFNIEIDKPVKISYWTEQYAVSSNNISNYFYNGKKNLLSKSSKISRVLSSKKKKQNKIVFYKNSLISHDHKGKIFIYSPSIKKKTFEYNFYKKKFKNIDKNLSFLINDNVLYVADNLGYLYALSLDNRSLIWAKNYGVPFRSNLKFANEQLFLANQDNVIYSIDPATGEKKWQFATSLAFIHSDFENNFALDLISENLLFLNTTGEMYSINYETQKINWVLNFKNPTGADTSLFLSQPIIIKNNNFIISTEKLILSYDLLNASRNWAFHSEPIIKPVASLNYTFSILKNDLLICLDNSNGKIIWSKNIFANIKEKKIRKKVGSIIDFKIVNSNIIIYFKNGHILNFDPKNGSLNSFSRISKSGINSEIFFLSGNMFLLDNKNKLLKFN